MYVYNMRNLLQCISQRKNVTSRARRGNFEGSLSSKITLASCTKYKLCRIRSLSKSVLNSQHFHLLLLRCYWTLYVMYYAIFHCITNFSDCFCHFSSFTMFCSPAFASIMDIPFIYHEFQKKYKHYFCSQLIRNIFGCQGDAIFVKHLQLLRGRGAGGATGAIAPPPTFFLTLISFSINKSFYVT